MTCQLGSKAPITLPDGILSPSALPVQRYGSKDLQMIPKYLLHGAKQPQICYCDIIALLNHALGSVSYSCALKIILRALQELFLRYKSPCFHYDCPPVIITIRKRFSPSVIEVPLQYTGPLCLELLIIEATFNNQLLCQQSVTQQL